MAGRSEISDQKPDTLTMFALHFLGGSAREWQPLVDRLAGRVDVIPIDLPGFGDAADLSGYTVDAMAAYVAGRIREHAPGRWILAGHSMGAKVACAISRMSEDGDAGLAGLSHLILVAGSPPGPEPMDDAKRQEMLGWFRGSEAENRADAVRYIKANVGDALPDPLQDGAIADVLRTRHAAWLAWLENGSREDWSARIGRLDTPALILAGETDEGLGADAQTTMMVPHFRTVQMTVLPKAGHLLPLECPDAVADCILDVLASQSHGEPSLDAEYRALIQSPRVNERTRQVLRDRLETVAPHPDVLDAPAMALLRLVVERLVPQQGERQIDLAARMVDAMATASGDGWRFADLPADAEALRRGLQILDHAACSLDRGGFAALSPKQRDTLLGDIANGRSGTTGPETSLSPQQMKRWFEDLCAAATQMYVAHPATQDRLGYSGIANRGDGAGPAGFVHVGLGEREPWEPLSKAKTQP
ncbi:alpha/beta hydrolase [Lichenihabitans psoromatis]|uniref:alpha/beta hydrolase n=1 Tax=Lichenihabitans psoromatis TaxID=2528642 RepID=UPI001FE19D0C|nr:alpha/beta hydrolase [Lichenihabitans psoromatis]